MGKVRSYMFHPVVKGEIPFKAVQPYVCGSCDRVVSVKPCPAC